MSSEKYNIAFSSTNLTEVTRYLTSLHHCYMICDDIKDIANRVIHDEVEGVYLYNKDDFRYMNLPMPSSAIKAFERICSFSGVDINFVEGAIICR